MAAERKLLRGGRVFDHDSAADLPAIADVLIEGDKIVAVAPDLDKPGEDVERIDLGGYLLLPGFVNAHYHSHDVLAKGFFETMPLEQWGLIAGPIANGRTLDEVRTRTLVGAIECLRNGITTVQDFSSFAPMEDSYVDAILDAYAETGIRVIFSITVRDRSQLDTIPWASELVPPELHAAVGNRSDDPDAQLAFIERQIDRVGDRGGMVIWALSPSAPQRCSPRLLRGVADLATRKRLPVYAHVYETRTQRLFVSREFTSHGGSAIDYMESVGLLGPHVTIAHGVWPNPQEIEKLAATGTRVVLNILSNLRLRSGVAPIAGYRRLSVPFALGCDNCSCSDVQSMFQVMKLYCLLGGISDPNAAAPMAAEALHIATVGGARSAGRGDRLGAIRPGMQADIVALDLSDPAYRPLNNVVRQVVYAETGRSVRHVWVNGRRVIKDGQAISIDEDRLDGSLAKLMPVVRRELERLRVNAEKVRPAFEEIQRRAWAADLDYNRYLQRS
jgi:5-methylthioadenosine/S-adenosylhomocysteine deaminase